MAATGSPAENALTELYELVINPNQSTDQISAGELTFKQVRTLVLQIQELVKGDGTPSRPGHDNVVVQLQALTQQISDVTNRIEQVEKTVPPVLLKADEEIKKIQAQSEDIKQVVGREVKAQGLKHDELIQHATSKFQELDVKQGELITHARNKFDDMEQAQQDMLTGATTRFDELEQFRKNFETQVAVKISQTDNQMRKVSEV